HRTQGVLDQCGDGHGANTTGHGGDPAGALGCAGKVDIAHQSAVAQTVHADIDHDGARLDPVSLDQLRLADTSDDNVRGCDLARQVLGARVADGDGAACIQKFQRHGAANDVGLADDSRIESGKIDVRLVQQRHHSVRCAGAQPGQAQGQRADVGRVKAVDILGRVDALEDTLRVDLLR